MAESTDAEHAKILLNIPSPMNNVIHDQLSLNLVDICLGNTLELLCKFSLRKPKVFALQIWQRYLMKEGRVRKFFDCLYG